MSFANRNDYSEDMFADTRMSFGEHLEDLRHHMWRALYGFMVAMVFGFALGWPLLEFISAPVERELTRFYDERADRVRKALEQGANSQIEAMNQPREAEVELSGPDLE